MKKYLLSLIICTTVVYYSIMSCPRKGNYFLDYVNNELEINDILKYKIHSVKLSRIVNGDTILDSENRYNESGEQYYYSYNQYDRNLIEQYFDGDSIRIFEKCVNGECLKEERITFMTDNESFYEKFDSNQQVTAWVKRKKWSVKDTMNDRIKNFLLSEYLNENRDSGLIKSLNSIDYFDEQNRLVQTDSYYDDSSFYSSYWIYNGDNLIKDSSENYQHIYYYYNDTFLESHQYSNELLISKRFYSQNGKIMETVYYNDTLSVIARNKSYFNQNGLDSFMLSYFMVDHYFESRTDSSIFWLIDNQGDSIFESALSEHDSLKVVVVPDTLIYEYEYY